MPTGKDGLIAGVIELKVNGEIHLAKGNFTYNLGKIKAEMMIGSDGVHGLKGTPQAPRIEGEITDRGDMSLEDFVTLREATITLTLANEKVIVLERAGYTGDGDAQTEEANIQAVFHGFSCEEVR